MVKISKTKHVTKKGVVKRNPSKANLYLKVRDRQEKEMNNFPMAFAFDNKQLEEGLKKLGIKKSEALGIGLGGFIRKRDKEKYIAMLRKHSIEHTKMLKNKTYVYQMFRYELSNHEFCVTGDYDDTLSAVGLTMDDINKNPMFKEQLEKATKDYMESARGWC